MLSTFIQTAAKKCKTKLLVLVRCFPQFGHSTQVQRHTTHILSVRCAPWATAQQQPTTKSHGPSKNGCMFLALNRSPFCRLGHWSHFYPLLGSICHFLLPFWLLDAHIGGPARSDTLFFGGGSCHRRFRLNVPRNGRTHFVVSMEDQHFCIGQGILSEMVVGQNPGILGP